MFDLPLGESDLGVDVDLGAVAGNGDLAGEATSLAINLDALVQEGLLRNPTEQTRKRAERFVFRMKLREWEP